MEWLIIGGGPHGLHIAASLLQKAGVPPDRLRILDPHPVLMQAWNTRAHRVGMSHLRSPSVHNVDVDPWSMQRFAEGWTPPQDAAATFSPPYSRPSTAVFAAHAEAVIERLGLDGLHVRGCARTLELHGEGWNVGLHAGALAARRVILALGPAGTQRVPAWAVSHLHDARRWVQHVFDPTFDLDARPQLRRVAVIGGGISAAQLATRLAGEGRKVWLVSPHRLRRMQFDSSPQWLGPAKMAGFSKEPDMAVRRRLIDRARRPGTVTKEVDQALRRAVRGGSVSIVIGEVRGVFSLSDRHVLGLRTPIEVDGVALATGFGGLPGGPLLECLDPELFPRAACGTPVVDARLHWGHGLYAAGALAELQLGPVARNIAGALRAAERLVPVAISGAGLELRAATG